MKKRPLFLESSKSRVAALYFAVKMARMMCLIWRFAKTGCRSPCFALLRPEWVQSRLSFHENGVSFPSYWVGGVRGRLAWVGPSLFVLCGGDGAYPAPVDPGPICPDGPPWIRLDPCNNAHMDHVQTRSITQKTPWYMPINTRNRLYTAGYAATIGVIHSKSQ